MAQEKIEIIFKPIGEPKLLKALNRLHNAHSRLAQSQHLVTQRVSSNTAALVVNTNMITKAKAIIALYRNTLLLAAFALGLVSKVLINQVKAFAKQEESVRRKAEVFGSKGALALDKFSFICIIVSNCTCGK